MLIDQIILNQQNPAVKPDTTFLRGVVRYGSAHSRCSGVKFRFNSMLIIPRMPFIGVRISWLMFARNWDLA
jgi:hypothetical protein